MIKAAEIEGWLYQRLMSCHHFEDCKIQLHFFAILMRRLQDYFLSSLSHNIFGLRETFVRQYLFVNICSTTFIRQHLFDDICLTTFVRQLLFDHFCLTTFVDHFCRPLLFDNFCSTTKNNLHAKIYLDLQL